MAAREKNNFYGCLGRLSAEKWTFRSGLLQLNIEQTLHAKFT